MFNILTLGRFHDSCNDFSKWSHESLRNAAPYKEGFDDAEFVINTSLLALQDNKVERVLSKIDSSGNVTTYRLDSNGKNNWNMALIKF